jgi:hypothetical protein
MPEEKPEKQHWAIPLVKALIPLIGVLAGWLSATSEARKEAGHAKDKAESGYQATKQAVEELREVTTGLAERFTRLEAEVAAVKRYTRNARLHASKRREAERAALAAAAAVKAAAPAPPVVTPLPNDLDKALVQQKEAAK